MSSLLERVADRTLAFFVPKTEASACACDGTTYWKFCFCNNSYHQAFKRPCHMNCPCTIETCDQYCYITNDRC